MNIKVMSLSLLTAGVVLTSCQSDPVYLDPDSMDGKVVTVEDINQQDWGNAADQLTNSLRMSGSIAPQKHKDHKNVVMVSRVRNETNEQ